MDWLQKDGYRLRAPEPEDLGCMMQFENTPSLWEVSSPSGPYSRFHLKQYLETTQNDLYSDRQLRLILESPEGKVAGIVDLFHFDPFHSRAEVGIVIADAYRCKGVGKLALEMLTCHCFQYLGIHQLYACIGTNNEASRRLFHACGFTECAYLKGWMRQGSDFGDVVMVQRINS